jgi:hypothetical protein
MLIVWAFGFLSMTIMSFQLCDILICDSFEIEIVSLIKKKRIGIPGLKIYNSRVAKGYIYLIETNEGEWWINKIKL